MTKIPKLALIDHLKTPLGASLGQLSRELAAHSPGEQKPGDWQAEQLTRCGQAGVFRWFIPQEYGGDGWRDDEVLAGYVALAAGCMTTTFVITQRTAACRRMIESSDEEIKRELLPPLATEGHFATVAISHLSTSRRHLGKPSLAAEMSSDTVRLDGYSAWVTGANHADTIVVGGQTADQRQLFVAVPRKQSGLTCESAQPLVALTASCTGGIRCDNVIVDRRRVLLDQSAEAKNEQQAAGTGGLSTSALAIGLAAAAIEFLSQERQRRHHLSAVVDALADQWRRLYIRLITAAGSSSTERAPAIRADANSLVLRATQAAMAAAKGAGFVDPHRVGRWCREALFFLVWSCPQEVVDANLAELADLPPRPDESPPAATDQQTIDAESRE